MTQVISLLSDSEDDLSSPPRPKRPASPLRSRRSPKRSTSRCLSAVPATIEEDDLFDSADDFSKQSRRPLQAPNSGSAAQRQIPNGSLSNISGTINSLASVNGTQRPLSVQADKPTETRTSVSKSTAPKPNPRNPFYYDDDSLDEDDLLDSPPKEKGKKSVGETTTVDLSRPAEIPDDDEDLFVSPAKRSPKAVAPIRPVDPATPGDFDSIIATSSPVGLPQQQKKPPRSAAAWDPISSSAPVADTPANLARSLRKVRSDVIALDDSDDDFPDINGLVSSKSWKRKAASKTTSTTDPIRSSPKPPPKPKAAAPKASTEPKKTAEEKAREKEAKAAEREAEKQRKQAEKELAKQEKAAEKLRAAALAEVNKVRTGKKVSAREMIVELPLGLNPTIKVQAEALLQDLEVEVRSCPSPVANVVGWRRKVDSVYNQAKNIREPIPERIEKESYAMMIMPAAQFMESFVLTPSSPSHIDQMKQHFPNCTIIYLIEGLTPFLRKSKNARNRQFTAAVRTGLETDPARTQSRRKNATTTEYIDEEKVEEALLELQVLHGALIHHTTAPVETSRWIAVFTQHISTVPYRRQKEATNDASAGFCMDFGQVRTGDNARDTYVRMLQEIGRVTTPIAWGIASEYDSVTKLVEGLEEKGPLALEAVRKSANKDGAFSDRAVGPSVSKRVYKIFTGTDETSTDV
ncbi:hypothetical protein QBC35DRAFT_472016 [Podospora australis]|uniref:ERCC4 domain-containing protein n=1 Tax=Podospora australis TaxID=1536484 RepID=A0AAN7AIS2_9PEZI|nr:hypothetical protein QBC35DRAFT_472016 [Podospora australis]